MSRVINFSSGPSMLPEPVLQQAAAEMLNWRGSGMSVMEMSHRGKEFISIYEDAERTVRALLQVPANRIGNTVMSVPQLKIMQELITLSVFAPFSLFYLREPLKLDYLWASLCMCGAAYFMFRGMR